MSGWIREMEAVVSRAEMVVSDDRNSPCEESFWTNQGLAEEAVP